jgi:acetolactate synthase-1/2/3 large subunit
MAKLTGGQAIVRTLTNHGVDTIFGLPGVQLDNTFDALYEARNTIRTIHTRHEQGAAYMALGYAQSSGKVGACIVGPGPGLLNAGAALATAAASNAPVLCIGGQLPSSQIGGGVGMTHEIRDQSAAMRGVAKWVGRAESAADAPGVLQDAFRQMLETRHQPVVFEMAPDVMGSEEYVDLRDVQYYDGSAQPKIEALDKAAALLGQAGKPAIFAGSGVFGAESELQRLSELLEAPVIMSRTGRGALGDRDYHAQGMIAGQDIWPSVDVALIVGTRFTTPALAWGRADEVKTVRIDIDSEQATKPRPSDITIISNARNGLAALCDLIEPQNRTRPSRETELRKVKANAQAKLETLEPQYGFAKVIRDEVPDDGIVVTDVTQMATYLQNWMPVHHPRTLITPSYQATLGYAFPTALGAQVAHPDRRVICISGDGGFMFNVQELSTAVAHHINVVTIVFADKAFGNVKRFQKDNYGERYIAVDLHNPDFAALAHTFGMTGIRAETPEELRAAIREAFAAPGPALIEVPVGEMPSVWDLIQRPSSAA